MIEKIKPRKETCYNLPTCEWVPEGTEGKGYFKIVDDGIREITIDLTPAEEKINEIIDYLNGKEGKE